MPRDAQADDIVEALGHSADTYLAACDPIGRGRALESTDTGFDAAAWRQLGALGWLGLRLPEAHGGAGLGLRAATALSRRIGTALLPEPWVACGLMPAALIGTLLQAGPDTPAAAWCEPLAQGDAIAALAWQEAAGQTDIGQPTTTLTRQADGHWRLHGTKRFVPAGATVWFVTAQKDGVPAVLALPAATAGVGIDSARMADGSVTQTLQFNGVGVPAQAVLGQGPAAVAALQASLQEGTIAVCAQLEGLASEALRLTGAYVQLRVQFDRPIAANQAVRHRIADLAMQTRLAGAAWRAALRQNEADPHASACTAATAAAKARCADAALLVTRSAIQLHGAIGYTDQIAIGRYLSSALRWAPWLGNGPSQRAQFLRSADLEDLAR